MQIELLPSWSITEAYLIWIRLGAGVIGFSESYRTRRTCLTPGIRIFIVAMEDTCTAAESAASVHVPSNLVGAPIFYINPLNSCLLTAESSCFPEDRVCLPNLLPPPPPPRSRAVTALSGLGDVCGWKPRWGDEGSLDRLRDGRRQSTATWP